MEKSLKHKIGQMLIAGFPSPQVDEQAKTLVEKYHVGNFALFGRNIITTDQVCALCDDLHHMAYEKNGYAAFIASDQEGGVVSRVGFGSGLFPGTMAMAASASAEPYQVGRNCSRVLGSMGIMGNFGPVLDVNMDPMNPIIGSRSFSDDPETVAKLGVQMVLGMQDEGRLVTLKHYPGHGNVAADSHLGVPVNSTPEDELMQTEWMPFARAFDAGADALMTCHVLFDQVDPQYPATLSHKIMTDLLRGTMRFKGLAITDCMEMDAIRAAYGIGRGAVLAVQAGCDILCFSHTLAAVAEAAEALYQAVESGEISMERIDESYNRIVAMKQKYNLLQPPAIDREAAQKMIRDPEMIALHARISKDSMTLISDNGGFAALKNAKAPRFFAPASIAMTGAEDKERAPSHFSHLAAERFGGDSFEFPMSEFDQATLDAIHDPSYDVAVLGLYNARFRESQRAILRELEKQERPLVVVLLGAPYDAVLMQNADCVICAYEYTWLACNALLDAMEEGSFPGHLPVKL